MPSENPTPAPVSVETTPDGVSLRVGEASRDLSRAAVERLRAALGEALTDSHEFVHTTGRHREDGAYVVERRGADSAGHRKVFDSRAACRRLYDDLPREFTATDVDAPGVSGGRRHMLVWHFVEHPAFDCSLVARQPLTVRKRPTAPATEGVTAAADD